MDVVLISWLCDFVRVVVLFILMSAGRGSAQAGLSLGFYSATCPSVEFVVANAVAARLQQDSSASGPLLRMFFHDCFVRGCDASVLLAASGVANNNNVSSTNVERQAPPNLTLREFGLIDSIKQELERSCPGVVSCADILALIAKEVVLQSGGPNWKVELGRRDGRVSTSEEASNNLPSTLSSIQVLIQSFTSKGLTIRDLVTLSGAHTIGVGHCFQASRRFFGFNSPNGIDPSLNLSYAMKLRSICHPPINPHMRLPLDASTPNTFDNTYYQNLLLNKGLFTSDSSLLGDARSRAIVQEYAHDEHSFFTNFISSMITMGRLGVLVGNQGEIRKHCQFRN